MTDLYRGTIVSDPDVRRCSGNWTPNRLDGVSSHSPVRGARTWRATQPIRRSAMLSLPLVLSKQLTYRENVVTLLVNPVLSKSGARSPDTSRHHGVCFLSLSRRHDAV
jgi:hypothetical protein